MILTIVIILIVLWFLGYFPVASLNIPDITLLTLNGQQITLWNILILAVIIWAIGILPSPFREIASVLLVIWILSVLGILAIAGLSSMIVIAIIIGLVIFLLKGA